MRDFRQFCENAFFVERVLNEFDQISTPVIKPKSSVKPWSAKKAEILDYWNKIRPNMPIIMQPLTDDESGNKSTYGEDGIRITGSYQFIVSILSKMKEILNYENPNTRLRLVFRGLAPDESKKPSFAFYVNVEKRSHGRGKTNLKGN